MILVVFGLTVSSSWGNGHATLWRGLIKALARQDCRVVFFERDTPYYAGTRDLFEIEGGELVLYESWADIRARARRALATADAAMVTSYCPDALDAASLIGEVGPPVSVFYDLDTPITLARLKSGETVPYVGASGLAGFDLVLSYTGGQALGELQERLHARRVHPLYGHVDPAVHRPARTEPRFAADLSYLGTYSADRQNALERFFVEPARRRPEQRFLIGGAQYPHEFPWTSNIFFARHVAPAEHPAFFSSSRLTLNVTRAAMAEMGWCPSGRLFEAAACGAALLSDTWPGLETFFEPGREILLARDASDALGTLDMSDAELRRVAEAGRVRVLAEHTSDHRAGELLAILDDARAGRAEPTRAAGAAEYSIAEA